MTDSSLQKTTWEQDCLRWRGRVLKGKRGHWCPDWDFLPIDETTDEIDCCTCNMSPFNEGGQFAWDATSLEDAQACLRKYQYRIVEGWVPKRNSVHLLFGGWYATALEHYHKHLADGADKEEALRKVVKEALISTWQYEVQDPETLEYSWVYGGEPIFDLRLTGQGRPWESDHSAKTRENLIRTIVWYVDHWKDDPLEVVTLQDGSPAVEYTFKLDIGNDILWCGHIDRLVTYEGNVYVQDQKTTGYTLSPNYFSKFSPHTQMSGYAFAGQAIYHSPVKGVVIDAVQIAVGFSRYERAFTFRTQSQLEEWLADAHYHIARAREAYQNNYYPMNPASCDRYGGCIFRGICSRSPEVRGNFLRGDFEQRFWNPLEAR